MSALLIESLGLSRAQLEQLGVQTRVAGGYDFWISLIATQDPAKNQPRAGSQSSFLRLEEIEEVWLEPSSTKDVSTPKFVVVVRCFGGCQYFASSMELDGNEGGVAVEALLALIADAVLRGRGAIVGSGDDGEIYSSGASSAKALQNRG